MQTLTPHWQLALHLLAYQYLCQGKPEKAEIFLELLVQRQPANRKLRLAFGYALLHAGKAAEAVRALETLDGSADAATQFLYGRALLQAGLKQRADAAFSRYRALRWKVPRPMPSPSAPTR